MRPADLSIHMSLSISTIATAAIVMCCIVTKKIERQNIQNSTNRSKVE